MWLEKKGAGSLQSNIGTLILLNLINQKALCQFTNPLLGDVGQDNNYRYTKGWLKTYSKNSNYISESTFGFTLSS